VVHFPPCGLPLLGCPCPLFLFLSLSWVLSSHKVWQGFIIIEKRAQNKVIGKVS